jgi:5-methylcytosine-specific restriction protein A
VAKTIKVKDLPAPINAAKADWLAGTTWIGFTPKTDSQDTRNKCTKTIQRQADGGYIIEYIVETPEKPNPGFENDPGYLAERQTHKEQAGRFIAVHKLRYSSRSLATILGVTSRKVIGLFSEQLGLEFVPVLHRLQGRLASEG